MQDNSAPIPADGADLLDEAEAIVPPALEEPLPLAGPYQDILDLLPAGSRQEAVELIGGTLDANPDAPGKLAHLVLLSAQQNAQELDKLLEILAVAERHEVLSSGSLFLNLGHMLLANGAIEAAMRAYVRASGLHPDNKWHAGQRLHDFINAKSPDTATVLAMIDGLEGATDFQVPDLFASLLTCALEIEEIDIFRCHRLARDVSWLRLSEIGNKKLAKGQHAAALRAYDCAAEVAPGEISLRLQMGITQFLAGRYVEAEREWALTSYIRTNTRSQCGLEAKKLRFLGSSWFAAIGHVACIDTYIKSMELGWRPKLPTAYVLDQANPPPGAALLRRWSRYIDVHGATGNAESIERSLIGRSSDTDAGKRLHGKYVECLTEDFWYGPDGDGRIRWYAPLGAEVERAWKAAGRGPLLSLDDEERARTRKMLAQLFGLPEDAWFVALHVREPGFHASWHKAHPGTRHADIAAYDRVIDLVTKAGGWVVRLGDRTMTPIAPRAQVIDYATSTFRNFDLDVFLCGDCRYFVGTNSGLSLLPPLFGRRCVLTNWSPIAIPNWYLDDIYIPKLVRQVGDDRHLTFKEMYGSLAGWTQWKRDYPDGVQTIEDNDPDDLVDAVRELHDEVVLGRTPTREDQALVERYNAIAIAGGSYVGSRIGARFLTKFKHLLED